MQRRRDADASESSNAHRSLVAIGATKTGKWNIGRGKADIGEARSGRYAPGAHLSTRDCPILGSKKPLSAVRQHCRRKFLRLDLWHTRTSGVRKIGCPQPKHHHNRDEQSDKTLLHAANICAPLPIVNRGQDLNPFAQALRKCGKS